MATFDRSGDGTTVPQNVIPDFQITKIYDASAYTALAIGDVVKLIDIPAKTTVWVVKWEILSADTTASRTMNIGDGTTANQYNPAAAVSVSAVASGCVLEGAAGATVSKYYAAGDTIQLTAVTAITNAKIKLTAYCARGDI